ncbi:hypothetical protein [Rhizobium leguminosarum]|uniref:hypothetical protein n=1 Tax=Rhizobium leguminosarum TaxID=384 RepID=UPI001C96850F|nr:hypothetical protein [Rhizobium leguminosarum]MBY5436502.1 hypothetical protein [Rhizobium leguminosarum]
MQSDAKDPITVGTYGFNVPCRRFLIRANVTKDRRLPVVDEFVLRLLKISEQLSVRRIATFLGLTEAEAEAVLADLVSAGLIVIKEDAVELHPSAHAHFRGAEDGVPRIVDVDPWIDRLWFDLVSRNMMAPEKLRPTRNLIDIKAEGLARELPVTFARKAFEENFAEYLRKVRKIANPDRFGLYSVSDVEPERFGAVVLRGSEDLVFDPHPRLRPNLLDVETENLMRYRPLANAMNDAYRALAGSEPSSSGLAEFRRMLSEATVSDAHTAEGVFDFPKWLSLNTANRVANRQNLIGASYLGRNIDFFTKLLEGCQLPPGIGANGNGLEILWFRPGGSNWGVTPDVQQALSAIKSAITRKHGKIRFRTKLIVPQVAKREHPRRFDRIFDEGFVAPAGHISPSLEVLHIPGMGSLVLVRVAFSPSVATPVGFALVDTLGVERVGRSLRWDKIADRSEELWSSDEKHQELVTEEGTS